ncbi:MAG TPA: DUF4402 domain-containing protein [Gemmatimonadaceae bacterium]
MTARLRVAGPAALPTLGLLALLLLAPRSAQAQGTTSQALAGVAVLDVASTVNGLRNLRFGSVLPGGSATVAPANAAGAGCSGGCQSGMVTFANLSKKGTDKFLVVTFPSLPATLSGPAGATLAASFQIAGCLVNQATASEYYCAAAGAATSAGNYRMQVNGPAPGGNVANRDVNFYIGGTVTAAPGQRPGSYTGTVTIAVTYSSV